MTRDVIHAQAHRPTDILLCPSAKALIEAESLKRFPHEACGLLVGRRDGARFVLEEAIACENAVKARSHDRFEIAPADLFAIHRQARAKGRVVLGHFHSHPNGSASPSSVDVSAIADPDAIWLIQAVTAQGLSALGAFQPNEEASGFNSLALSTRHP